MSGPAKSSRETMRGRRIVGHWPDGLTATATWSDIDEWLDDRYGDVVDFPEDLVGAPEEQVRRATRGTFWNGATRVEWSAP